MQDPIESSVVAPQKSEIKDMFGNEFDTPTPAKAGAVPGTHEFPAEFVEQVTGKLPSQPAVAPPAAPPQPAAPPPEPTTPEEALEQVAAIISATPGGLTQEELNQLAFSARVTVAQKQFLHDHPDYAPTPENGELIFRYCEQHNLPPTAESFDEAYEATQSMMMPKEIAAAVAPPAPPRPQIPARPASRLPARPDVVTGLPDRPTPAGAPDEIAQLMKIAGDLSQPRDVAENAMRAAMRLRQQQMGRSQGNF